MSTFTENDLKELKDLINSKFEKVDHQFESVNGQLNQVNEKVNIISVDIASIKGKQEGFDKRLDNLEFTNRGILITVVGGILLSIGGIFFKLYNL